MADKDRKDIDFDELDELPDVVLGDETRAIRTIHENGGTTEEIRAIQEEHEKALKKAEEPEPAVDEEEIPASLLDDDPGVKDELSELAEPKEEPVKEEPEKKEPAVPEKSEAGPEAEDDLTDEDIDVSFPEFEAVENRKSEEVHTEDPYDAVDANTTAMRRIESDIDTIEQEHTATMGIPLYLHNPGTGTFPKVSEEPADHAEKKKQDSRETDEKSASDTTQETDQETEEAEETSAADPSSTSLKDQLFGEQTDQKGKQEEEKPSEPEASSDNPKQEAEKEKIRVEKIQEAVKDEKRDARDDLTQVVAKAEEEEKKAAIEERDIPTLENKKEETKKPVRKKRKLRKPVRRIIAWILLIILLIIMCLGIYGIYQKSQPVSSVSEEVPFQVDENATLKTVSQKLEEEGIVKDADLVYLYGRVRKLTDLKHGAFVLDKSWNMDHILRDLNDETKGMADSVYVTIVEGDWAKDAAAKFASVTNVSADDLLALWNNADWIRSQMSTYPFLTEDMFRDGVRIYLEGYLAPNTYLVKQETTPEEITTQILNETLRVYDTNRDAIAASGRSIHDIYTLASIVQYEAGKSPEDMAKVASVFYNRMAAGMPLQSSVTVCYAIDFDKQTDNWQACEVNSDFDSLYNTYQHQGLPPGAIENAGTDALNAVLNPADTDYLYFMADVLGDGTIYYANTLEEHNANVAKYLQQ
jgi:UPF0755 protein